MTYAWPYRLLTPRSQLTRMVGRTVAGGSSLSGIVQVASISGGGRWTTALKDILVYTEDQFRALRAWSAYLDEGARQVIVPAWDLRCSPRGYAGGERIEPGTPAPAADYFSWEPGFGAPMISAHLVADAALRATALSIEIDVGVPLLGGEHFSINHPASGWRLYRVARVISASGTVQSIEIRPPLREVTGANTALEFDVPRCTMMLDPASAADLEPETNPEGYTTVSASFVEAF